MQTLTDQQEINKFMQSKQTLNDRKDSIMFTPANLIWELQVLINLAMLYVTSLSIRCTH